MSRRVQGTGSISKRQDGRWEAAAYMPTASGASRRIRVYGKTSKEVSDKLTVKLADVGRGIPVPERSWTIGAYLDYFMENIAPKKLRPRTQELYASLIRRHIKPILGSRSLTGLTVIQLQCIIDEALEKGMTANNAFLVKTVLMSALTNAMREDLVVRNVARLLMLPPLEPRSFQPWTVQEVARFLAAVKTIRLYPVFLILCLYGPRRGEVLGLRWSDVDWDHHVLHIRQQLVRQKGGLRGAPLKTKASKRDLPLLVQVRDALNQYQADTEALGIRATGPDDLIFRKDNGRPLSPEDLNILFHSLLRKTAIRRIHLHGLRHTAATLLKDAGVPDKDIQLILGHARVSTTQNLYEHGNIDAQHRGLQQLESALQAAGTSILSRQIKPSTADFDAENASFQSVNFPNAASSGIIIARMTQLSRGSTSTPVIHQLRLQVTTYIFGTLAVSLAVNSRQPEQSHIELWQWISLHDALSSSPTSFIDQLATTTRSRL